MPKKLSTVINDPRLLYSGIALLCIVVAILIFILFRVPAAPVKPAPASFVEPPIDQNKVNELLTAPSENKPANIPPKELNMLQGEDRKPEITQQEMNLLSAPPPQKQ